VDPRLREVPTRERLNSVDGHCEPVAGSYQEPLITPDQRAELDRRLMSYRIDRNRGRLAANVLADVRRRL